MDDKNVTVQKAMISFLSRQRPSILVMMQPGDHMYLILPEEAIIYKQNTVQLIPLRYPYAQSWNLFSEGKYQT